MEFKIKPSSIEKIYIDHKKIEKELNLPENSLEKVKMEESFIEEKFSLILV